MELLNARNTTSSNSRHTTGWAKKQAFSLLQLCLPVTNLHSFWHIEIY